jgi:hypothetical protein
MKHLQLVQHASSRLNNRLHFRFTENMLPLASIFIKMNGWMDGYKDGHKMFPLYIYCAAFKDMHIVSVLIIPSGFMSLTYSCDL